MKSLRSIQYLRAAAALAVVAYHAGQWIFSPVTTGAAGVDVFFVISGFVMWISTRGRQVSPAAFLWRRLIRVAPLYWLATLALAAGAAASPGLFPHVTPQAGHILRSMLFIPHSNPEGDPFPLLAAGWTLNYEAVFYVIFAAALFVPPGRRLAVLAAALGAVASFGMFHHPAYPFLANPLMLQFLGGAILGRLWLDRALPSGRTGLIVIGLAVAALAASHFLGVVPESLLRPLLWGLPAGALVLGAVAMEAEGKLPRWPALSLLGDASYAIYLCHTPVLALWNRAIGPTDPAVFFAGGLTLSLTVGLACHLLIERPLLAALRRRKGAPVLAQGGA